MEYQIKTRQRLKNSEAQFILLIGESGSGKKTILREIYPDAYWLPDISVESVRTMIRQAYKQHNATFIIADADTMSPTAKNALLKVVEECPNNNRFIMTLSDTYNALETVLSRASVVYMDWYTPSELIDYFETVYGKENPNDVSKATEVCSTPGELNTYMRMGADAFYDYVVTVVNHINTASLANALKIGTSIAFKGEDDKYDLKLFWKAFITICCALAKEADNGDDLTRYGEWADITSDVIKMLRVTGINKSALFTTWILEIREYGSSND